MFVISKDYANLINLPLGHSVSECYMINIIINYDVYVNIHLLYPLLLHICNVCVYLYITYNIYIIIRISLYNTHINTHTHIYIYIFPTQNTHTHILIHTHTSVLYNTQTHTHRHTHTHTHYYTHTLIQCRSITISSVYHLQVYW